MNDVSVVVDSIDTVVRPIDAKVQSDTNNDTDNDTSNNNRVTWSNHAQQRITYGDGDDTITSTYGDGDDTIDISETLTLVKKPYIYKSYMEAYSGSKEACSGSPITYERETITHHMNPNSRQVTSE